MTTHPDEAAFGFSETRYDADDGRPIGSLTRRGITKREYFAALAMQGLLASEEPFTNQRSEDSVATLAVQQADALIAALNGEGQANG